MWVVLVTGATFGQPAVEELNAEAVCYAPETWKGFWITHPDVPLSEYSVVHFRRTFELSEKSEKFIVHVSADNRYELYVNGQFVCTGPMRADLQHWRYETVDLAPFLREGRNAIAAMVVNWGPGRMKAQFSSVTAFFLAGHSDNEAVVNSDDDDWKVYWNKAYSVRPVRWMYSVDTAGGWYCGNPTDQIDGAKYPWGWEQVDYDDNGWAGAKWYWHGATRGTPGHSDWLFVPRRIKLLEHKREPVGKVVRCEGIEVEANAFDGKSRKSAGHLTAGRLSAVEIPADTKATILIDKKEMTIGYPQIVISGGKGSEIRLGYAECLYDKDKNKGNRDDIEGKQFIGYKDVIIADGGTKRRYRPTWHRAFRFLQVEIETKGEPLVIDELSNIYTTYPLEAKARFECDDEQLMKIWDICWRTVKLCSQDMLMSDAYYETMQYTFDARNHALTLFYISGDTALWREAIRQFDNSRIPDGIGVSAYPNNWYWIIPYYSLSYADMLYDYVMATGDKALAREMVPGIRATFGWFENRINERGILGELEWAVASSGSVYSTLAYAYTLRNVADVWEYIGLTEEAGRYRARAKELAKNVYELCFDEEKGLIAESPAKNRFRDMTTVLAVLTDSIPKDKQRAVIEKISTRGIGYSRWLYLADACKKVELGDKFDELLGLWDKALELGLTTCPETQAEVPRSDCHPWSTNPPVHYFRTICGIEPAEPGYTKVRIEPALGKLKWVRASLPTPRGAIEVDLRREGEVEIAGTVTLPENVGGKFVCGDIEIELKSGSQVVGTP